MSAEIAGDDVDLQMAVNGSSGSDGGIAHGALLSDFATAAVTEDHGALERTRAQILQKLGEEQLVDAAALVAHFEKMDRIADSTGIPSDAPIAVLLSDLRGRYGLGRFGSAENTRAPGALKLALGRMLRGIVTPLLRRRQQRS